MQRFRGVLLDVDGTLVDSNDAHVQAWVKAISENGMTVPFAVVRKLIGKGGDKLLPEAVSIDADSSPGKAISDRRAVILRQKDPANPLANFDSSLLGRCTPP